MILFYIAAAILAVVLMCVYVSWRAGRLDRLHHRVDAARTALDLALVRRSASAYELASSGLLDPATSLLLADAARRTKDGDGPAATDDPASGGGTRDSALHRELAESDLTRALRAAFSQPQFRESLNGSRRRRRSSSARSRPPPTRSSWPASSTTTSPRARSRLAAARWHGSFRLAGHAPQPAFFEMDDALFSGG